MSYLKEKDEENSNKHLAGIIATNSQPMDFDFPWHDSMIPIAPGFLAIERAVLECATAGCDTIWIVCSAGFIPLIRHKLGDAVIDPENYLNQYIRFKKELRREISIYYIAVHPRDVDKRDSIVWNILYGCRTAARISNGVSKWIIPEKYYICLPNVVYPSQIIIKYRQEIRDNDRCLISFVNKTILNGKPYACTITNSEVKFLIKEFRDQATGQYDGSILHGELGIPKTRLPIDKRYSGRFLTLKDVFEKLPCVENTTIINLPWAYNLDSFDNMCEYLGSEHRKLMHRPKTPLIRYKEFDGIASENTKK